MPDRFEQSAVGVLVIRMLCLTVSRRRTGFIAIFDGLYAFETGFRRKSNHAIEYSYSKVAFGTDRVNFPTAIGLDSSYKNAAGLALGGVSHMGEGLAGWV